MLSELSSRKQRTWRWSDTCRFFEISRFENPKFPKSRKIIRHLEFCHWFSIFGPFEFLRCCKDSGSKTGPMTFNSLGSWAHCIRQKSPGFSSKNRYGGRSSHQNWAWSTVESAHMDVFDWWTVESCEELFCCAFWPEKVRKALLIQGLVIKISAGPFLWRISNSLSAESCEMPLWLVEIEVDWNMHWCRWAIQ